MKTEYMNWWMGRCHSVVFMWAVVAVHHTDGGDEVRWVCHWWWWDDGGSQELHGFQRLFSRLSRYPCIDLTPPTRMPHETQDTNSGERRDIRYKSVSQDHHRPCSQKGKSKKVDREKQGMQNVERWWRRIREPERVWRVELQFFHNC